MIVHHVLPDRSHQKKTQQTEAKVLPYSLKQVMSATEDEIKHEQYALISVQNVNNALPPTLNECTVQHLISLITYHASFDDKIINSFKHTIIRYLHNNQMNGQSLINTKRKAFAEAIITYSGNNKKIRGASNKTWDKLTKYKFNIISTDTTDQTSQHQISTVIDHGFDFKQMAHIENKQNDEIKDISVESLSSSNKMVIHGIFQIKEMFDVSWKGIYLNIYSNGLISYYEIKNESKKTNMTLNEIEIFKILTRDTTSTECDRKYAFELITTTGKKYWLSCYYLKQLNKWSKFVEQYVDGNIVKRGHLNKFENEGIQRLYEFVLYDSKKLLYYDDNKGLTLAGMIDLKSAMKDTWGNKYITPWIKYKSDNVIEIQTSTRILAVTCEKKKDLRQWFDAISNILKDLDVDAQEGKLYSMFSSNAHLH